MNREIKFRAWDKLAKRMRSFDWLCVNRVTFGNLYVCNKGLDESGLIFLQYTGLKDKNGKEIYEGDIVSYGQLSTINLGEEMYEVVYCADNGFPSFGLRSLSENIITPRIDMIKITSVDFDPEGNHAGIIT